MKNTRKIAALCAMICGAVLFTACQPEPIPAPAPVTPAPTAYYVRFKIDGVEMTYTGTCAAQFCTASSIVGDTLLYSIITGNQTVNVNAFNLVGLTIQDAQPLVTGVTYTNDTPLSASEEKPTRFDLSYTDANGVIFSNLDEASFSPLGLISDAQLVLTDITATYIKGRFSATLYDDTFTTPQHVLSDGEFYVQRLQ